MIVRIEAQYVEVERDGWLCAEPTGIYTVVRVDQSKRDVTRDELIALLKLEPFAVESGACPKCGAVGNQFHQYEPDGDNFICPTCGTYRVEVAESLDIS